MKKSVLMSVVMMISFLALSAAESPLLTSAQRKALEDSPSITCARPRACSYGLPKLSLDHKDTAKIKTTTPVSTLQQLLGGNSPTKDQESPK